MTPRSKSMGRWPRIAAIGLVLAAGGWQAAPAGPEGGEPDPLDDGPEVIIGGFRGDPELSPAVVARFFSEDAGRSYGPRPIPDDPPHEGATFHRPHVFGPADLIRIEVLEALPGRPITGERLVRPDGTVSLDWYGEVDVKGLTADQVKIQVIERLRTFLTDENLGLVELVLDDPPWPASPHADDLGPDELPEPPRTRNPFDLDFEAIRPTSARVDLMPGRDPTGAEPGPSRISIDAGNGIRITIETPAAPPSGPAAPEESAATPEPSPLGVRAGYAAIPPVESNRVFVDVAAYNTPRYFVTGDVAYPGRLVCTGNETVLDALNDAGGLLPVADPTDIRLVRPSGGDRPARVYPIDLDAILAGDATANLQLFPGDRLIVGRDPVVEASVASNRLAEPLATLGNIVQNYEVTLDRLEGRGSDYAPEHRARLLRAWADLWEALTTSGDATPGQTRRLLEEMIRLLDRPAPPADDAPADQGP